MADEGLVVVRARSPRITVSRRVLRSRREGMRAEWWHFAVLVGGHVASRHDFRDKAVAEAERLAALPAPQGWVP